MKVSTTNAPAAEIQAEALILTIPEGTGKPTSWDAVDAVVGGIVSEALAGPGFQGKRGQTLALSTPGNHCRELVLVGLGIPEEFDLEVWRRAVANGIAKARQRGSSKIAVPLPEIDGHDSEELSIAATEAAILTSYRYREFKDDGP